MSDHTRFGSVLILADSRSEILGPSMTILREFHGAVLEACNIYIYIYSVPPKACNSQQQGSLLRENTAGAQANQVFLVANLLNSKDFSESVDSNCVLNSGFATFWIFPFGSHVIFYV